MSQFIAILGLCSALFYCAAMVAMKSWAEIPSLGLALLIGAALLTAGTFETYALRHEKLGLIYVGILGAEVVILSAFSYFYFDENYSTRELAGMCVVLVGTAIAWT